MDTAHVPNIIVSSPRDYYTTKTNWVIDSSYASHSGDEVPTTILFSTLYHVPIDTNPITITIICFSEAMKAAKFTEIKIKYVLF